MKKVAILVLSILMLIACSISAFGQPNDPESLFAKSESFTTQGNFYEALIALQPLLVADQKSPDQIKALWTANALCETLIRDNIILIEYENTYSEKHTKESPSIKDYMQYSKIVALNKLEAGIGFNELGGCYAYDYGFLRKLVETYPDSKLRPSAEYYLITRGYNEPKDIEKWLDDLYSYINQNAGTGLEELNMAYLDIAHINDNLWQMLAYPDGAYSKPFQSNDPAQDKERANKYKAESLKYYARVIISGYSPKFADYSREDIKKRFQELKDNKTSNYGWIIYD